MPLDYTFENLTEEIDRKLEGGESETFPWQLYVKDEDDTWIEGMHEYVLMKRAPSLATIFIWSLSLGLDSSLRPPSELSVPRVTALFLTLLSALPPRLPLAQQPILGADLTEGPERHPGQAFAAAIYGGGSCMHFITGREEGEYNLWLPWPHWTDSTFEHQLCYVQCD